MTQPMTPVCYGYQGKGNVGDNLMFLLNTAGFDAVYVRKGRRVRPDDIELGALAYLWQCLAAKELIFSGGNIFNVDRPRSVVKIAGFFLLVHLRRLMGKTTSFRSIGVNKNTPPFVRSIAIRTILAASHAHLRETSITSTALWQRSADRHHRVEFAPDIVFTGDLDAVDQINGFRNMAAAIDSHAVYFPSIVARREAAQQATANPDAIAVPDDITTVYVIVQAVEDADIAPDFLAGKDVVQVQSGVDTIDRILALVLTARLVVTERYHGAILAKRFGIPMITSNYSEKLRDIEMIAQ